MVTATIVGLVVLVGWSGFLLSKSDATLTLLRTELDNLKDYYETVEYKVDTLKLYMDSFSESKFRNKIIDEISDIIDDKLRDQDVSDDVKDLQNELEDLKLEIGSLDHAETFSKITNAFNQLAEELKDL